MLTRYRLRRGDKIIDAIEAVLLEARNARTPSVIELNGVEVLRLDARPAELSWWPREAAWRWSCRYVDGPRGQHSAWHYDKDDCGFAATYQQAFDAALDHLHLHAEAGRLPPYQTWWRRALRALTDRLPDGIETWGPW